MQKLLLFDIDGTLLDTGGAGLRSLRAAFLDVFVDEEDHEKFPDLDLAGSTDAGIVKDLLAAFEIEHSEEGTLMFYERYVTELHGELDRAHGAEECRILPGIRELLHHLRDNTAHVLGLLTGNIADGAWAKVGSFGLDGIFEFGAFGDDHHDRNELGPIALGRASELSGRSFESVETFIIGDTPKDIRCARACGAVAVAVATGRFSAGELSACEPDHLFEDFSDIDAFEEILA